MSDFKDELGASVPVEVPPELSEEWLAEISRRSLEIDSGSVTLESWSDIWTRLFARIRCVVQIEFHPEAVAEFEASPDWFVESRPTADDEFCVAVDTCLEHIFVDPDRFAQIDDRHRASVIPRFPFQIVFRHDADRLIVLAIAHAEWHPGDWRNR
jgi:hypothetical protein